MSPPRPWSSGPPAFRPSPPSAPPAAGHRRKCGQRHHYSDIDQPRWQRRDKSATIAVSITPAPEPLLSLTIIPSSTYGPDNLQGTGQFLAIGTYATPPYVRDLTNSPNLTWISSFPSDLPGKHQLRRQLRRQPPELSLLTRLEAPPSLRKRPIQQTAQYRPPPRPSTAPGSSQSQRRPTNPGYMYSGHAGTVTLVNPDYL